MEDVITEEEQGGHNSRKEKVVKSEIVLGLPIMDPDFLYKCV
jgi:hypothetical protein